MYIIRQCSSRAGSLGSEHRILLFDSHDFSGLGNQSCEIFLVKAFLIVTSFRNSLFRSCPLFLQFSSRSAAAAKSLQSCPTLCDPIDSNPPGSPIPGILQAKTLEWVAISLLPNAWKWKVKVKSISHVWLLATPWTAAYQAPPSMGFSRQEYWSGVPSIWDNFDPDFDVKLNWKGVF